MWQLADSALPIGGFAHSAGLEAATQWGAVRNRTELREWLAGHLGQLTRSALPFVNEARTHPDQLSSLDHLCEAFTSNHVANRASRAQGRALLTLSRRLLPPTSLPAPEPLPDPPFAHLAPVFGYVAATLVLDPLTATRLFMFQQLRGALSAAVRLNLIGPLEAQALQSHLASDAESAATTGARLGLDDLAQTAPLLDLWQATQDRLYSRLFQS